MTCMVNVTAKPNSSKNEVAYDNEKNIYTVYIKASPDKGKANMELIKLLRRYFGKNVEIVRGFTGKHKVIKITD